MADLTHIEPGIAAFLAQMRADMKACPQFNRLSFPEQRLICERVRARWHVGGPVMAETREWTMAEDAGGMRVRLYCPDGVTRPAPTLIYLHGGGYTLFSINTHDRLMREYAEAAQVAVLGVDYPLAPEHKYPEALNRLELLLLWLADHGTEIGVDPAHLMLGGDSAGANLSFAVTQRLRDTGRHRLVRGILSNYGGFSAEVSEEAEAKFGGPGSIMDKAEAETYFENYIRTAKDRTDSYAFPIHADVQDFPPVFLVIAESDIVNQDSFVMEEKLKAAAVQVQSKVYPGTTHSFLEAMSVSARARAGIADGADFIRKQIA